MENEPETTVVEPAPPTTIAQKHESIAFHIINMSAKELVTVANEVGADAAHLLAWAESKL